MGDLFDSVGTLAGRVTDWIQANAAWLPIVITVVLAVFGAISSWMVRWPAVKFEPVLESGPANAPDDEQAIVIRMRNLGEGIASFTQYRWTSQFDCRLEPLAVPFYLAPKQDRDIRFSIDQRELAVQQISFPDRPPLGTLELFYTGFIRARRRIGFVLTSDTAQLGYGVSGVTLQKLPPQALRERWRLARWIHEAVTQPEKHRRKLEESQARGIARHLANSKAMLKRRHIRPSVDGFDRHRLLSELERRGWSYSFQPGGYGYEAEVSKTWPPSSSWSIVSYGESVDDALTNSLAAAIRADEEVLIPARPWPDDTTDVQHNE